MAEVHFLGQIVGGSGFCSKGLLCKWGIEAGSNLWDVLEGWQKGQTQTSWACDGDHSTWAHPLDVHFQCNGLSGWPKLHLQVWSVDSEGRTDICGYGFVTLPTAPGMYNLECPTWVPEGTALERMVAFFGGGRPRLVDESVAYTGNDRFRLSTVSSGTVHVQVGCMTRDFAANGVAVG